MDEPIPGLDNPSLSIAKSAGKFGDALAFASASDNILIYKAEKNVAYSHEKFQGTASFWMRLDPAEIGGQYSDPLQLTDKNYSDDCIWIDFTKNDTPSDFRLGVFGDRGEWDTKNLRGNSQEFFWRLAKITEPPFAKDRWTHVVITWADNEVQQRVDQLLARFNLSAYAEANPFTLSWGQKRRLSVATMIALDQPILVLDEPTLGQDRQNVDALIALIQQLHQQGTTIVLITHELELVAEVANTVTVLHQGQLRYHGTTRHLFAQPNLLAEAQLELPPWRAWVITYTAPIYSPWRIG